MLHSLFQTICRVGIFMICAQALMHFRAGEVYEKYLKLLVSIMILIQLFLPVGNFFLGKGTLDTAGILEQFRQGLEQGMREAEENAAAADALLEQMTLEEIRNRTETNQADGEELLPGDTVPEASATEDRFGEAGNREPAEPEEADLGKFQQDTAEPPAGQEENEAKTGEIEIRVEEIGPVIIE